MPTAESDRELSRLESLPGEILNSIYRYSVVEESLVDVRITTGTGSNDVELWQTNEPALAKVCKRFRKEVLPIYYSENTFAFPNSQKQRDEGNDAIMTAPKQAMKTWIDIIGSPAAHFQQVGGCVCDCKRKIRKLCGRQLKMKFSEDVNEIEFSFLDGTRCPDLKIFKDEKRHYKYLLTDTTNHHPAVAALCACWEILACHLA